MKCDPGSCSRNPWSDISHKVLKTQETGQIIIWDEKKGTPCSQKTNIWWKHGELKLETRQMGANKLNEKNV